MGVAVPFASCAMPVFLEYIEACSSIRNNFASKGTGNYSRILGKHMQIFLSNIIITIAIIILHMWDYENLNLVEIMVGL